ncbi:hypothetical protein ABBQ32_003602 [Trebouxia sp. C0010 RCD-2024]
MCTKILTMICCDLTLKELACLAAALQSLTHMTNLTRCPRQCYVCCMTTTSGKIPHNHELRYQLASHSDKEMQAASDIFRTACSSNSPGLIPYQSVQKGATLAETG